MTPAGTPLIVALDRPSLAATLELVDQLDPKICRVKVGKELFTAVGPAVLEALHQRGFEVFLDLKFHDIPNTTAASVASAARLGAWMIDVHASGGRAMLEAASAACRSQPGPRRPLLIGVTVLTSLDSAALLETGVPDTPETQVMRLAGLARDCGLDGVVCSAREAAILRREFGPGFVLVTPGIRPAGVDVGDQRRTLTPAEAVSSGSNYLVVGRPITASESPASAARRILSEISYIPEG